MSNLSELLPAGGAAKEFEPVASGTLPNGRTVSLKANGQVEILGETTGVGIQIPLGTSTQFNNANSQYIAIAYNPNTAGQFVIAWKNYAAGNLVAVVGTVSGTTLTFGSITQIIAEVVVYNEVLFDPNTANRFIVVGTNEGSSNRGSAWVGTISGSSLSFSAEMFWNSGGTSVLGGAAFDPNDAGHFITTWYDGNNSNYGTLVTGYVSSATNINYMTEVVFHSAYVASSDIAFAKSNGVFVIAYRGTSTAAYGRIGVRNTNYPDTATLYTAATFSTNNCTDIRVAWDKSGSSWNDGKIIITYEDNTNGDYRLVLGTVNSSTYAITFGTPIVITTEALYPDIEFDPSTLGRFIITYGGKVKVGTISGTTITLGTEIIYQSTGDIYGTKGYVKAAFDTAAEDGRFVIASRISQEGKAILSDLSGTVTTTNVADFVGITAEAITSGATGVVVPQGGVASSVANIAINATVPDGNAVYFSTGRGRYSNVQWDPSDSTKFVVAWADGSTTPTYQGYAAVGSVSGNTITYGTPVQFDSLSVSDMDTNSIAFDPNQSGRFVIFYSGVGGQGSRAIAGTRSGTNLSFGTSVQVFNNPAVQPSIEFDPNTSGQFLMNWGDGANNLRVGTLSGTTITLGTLVSISASYNQPNLVADPNNAGKYLIVYQDGADSDHGYVAVVTVTGTTPSMATPVKFLSAACVQPKIVYDSGVADAFVMVFVDGGNSSQARAIAGVVSGTTVSFGTAITFNSNANNQLTTIISADPNKTGSFIAVADVNTIGEATFLTRSGTNTITAGATHTLYNAAKLKGAIAFNPSASKSGQFVYVTEDRSASPYKSISVLGQGAYTTSVIVPGTDYYVQADGTVSTVSTSPAVNIGKAISTTSLILKG